MEVEEVVEVEVVGLLNLDIPLPTHHQPKHPSTILQQHRPVSTSLPITGNGRVANVFKSFIFILNICLSFTMSKFDPG